MGSLNQYPDAKVHLNLRVALEMFPKSIPAPDKKVVRAREFFLDDSAAAG